MEEKNTFFGGLDIGKNSHAVAILLPVGFSPRQKTRYKTFLVKNDRLSFEAFLRKLQEFGPASAFSILLESTGHYGAAIIQFLQEHNVTLYRISPKEKYGTNKDDINDAKALCSLLYNQIGLGAIEIEESWRVRLLIPAVPVARSLRGLVQHRYELVKGTTRIKNQMSALLNELFPEFIEIYKKPQLQSALLMRMKYPDPQAIAAASLEDLYKVSPWSYPQRSDLARLQELARTTIGTKNAERRETLLLNQQLYIERLLLLEQQIDRLDVAIRVALRGSREAQILMSFVGIAEVVAPMLIARIGNIDNFEKASELRAFLGWSPKRKQTGSTYDSTTLNRKSDRIMRSLMFLVVNSAVVHDDRWRALYRRLIPSKTIKDPKTGKDLGKLKVQGRIAGQIIKIIFVLLKRDAALVARYKQEGREGELPPPELYDRDHLKHATLALQLNQSLEPLHKHTTKQPTS